MSLQPRLGDFQSQLLYANMCVQLHDFGPEWSREMRKGWDEWREDQYWCLRSMVKPGKGVPVAAALDKALLFGLMLTFY